MIPNTEIQKALTKCFHQTTEGLIQKTKISTGKTAFVNCNGNAVIVDGSLAMLLLMLSNVGNKNAISVQCSISCYLESI